MEIRTISSVGYDMWSSGVCEEGIGNGIIEIEPGFQMIAIPITYGYWSPTTHAHVHDNSTPATIYNYVVTQIEDVYAVQASTMVEVFYTLVGGVGFYYNFIPNLINPGSPHNFELSYFDSGAGHEEVTGFFVKSIHTSTFTIQWGEI